MRIRSFGKITFAGSKFSFGSGGHNSNVNTSSIDTGVLINLSKLNQYFSHIFRFKDTITISHVSSFGDLYRMLQGTGVFVQYKEQQEPLGLQEVRF